MESEIGQISIFLAKDGKSFESVLDADANLAKVKGVKSFDFKSNGADCRFFYFEKPSTKSNPPWLDFVNEKLPAAEKISFGSGSKSANGILLIGLEKRVFVATFGRSAQSYIAEEAFEPDFGIKTAMNMCGSEELRQTKSQSTSIAITHIDRQVSKPSDALAFGLGEAEDLEYISAHMKGKKHITLQGQDNLTLKILGKEKITWVNLIEHCKSFLENSTKKDFQGEFPNFKNFEAATEAEATQLDDALIARLKKGDFSKIQLCIPEFTPEDEYSFSYTNNKTEPDDVYAYLDVDQLKKELKLKTITKKKLAAKYIYLYSPEEHRVLEYRRQSLYKCIVFEHSIGNKYFILSKGRWKLVEPKFYKSIVDFTRIVLKEEQCEHWYKDIDIYDGKLKKNREAVFNREVVERRKSCVLFDQSKLPIGNAHSNKEFCDILDMQDDGVIRIINAKQYKDASSISYLFSQTQFYSEAFLGDPVFLKAIRAHIQRSASPIKQKYLDYIKSVNQEVHGKDYRLSLWLLYNRKEPKPKKEDMPLLAQYELKLMHDHLTRICKFKDIILRFVPVSITQHTASYKPNAVAAKTKKSA